MSSKIDGGTDQEREIELLKGDLAVHKKALELATDWIFEQSRKSVGWSEVIRTYYWLNRAKDELSKGDKNVITT